MVDAAQTDGIQGDSPVDKPTFDDAQQEFINEMISGRIGEIKAKHEKEIQSLEARYKKEMERSRLDEEARAKAEREDELAEITRRAETAERALRIAQAERDLEAVGLPRDLAEIVLGSDDRATENAIKALDKVANDRANALYADRVRKGAPEAPEGNHTVNSLKDMMRQAAGLPLVKGGQ